MLFGVDHDSPQGIAGYLVPDAPQQTGEIRVTSAGQQVYCGPCTQVLDPLVAAGRHATGRAGFDLGPAQIPGWADLTDVQVTDAVTGLVIFRRPQPHHLARRVFHLETARVGAAPLLAAVAPHMAFAHGGIEHYGQETTTQLFHLKTYGSFFVEGRVAMARYHGFLTPDLFSLITLYDPFEHLALCLAGFARAPEASVAGLDPRDQGRVLPLAAYVAGWDMGDVGRVIGHLRRAPKAVLDAVQSPLTAQLVGGHLGQSVTRADIPRALDVVSQFSMVRAGPRDAQTCADIEAALGLPPGVLARCRIAPAIAHLAQALRDLPQLHSALECDLIVHHYVRAALQNAAA